MDNESEALLINAGIKKRGCIREDFIRGWRAMGGAGIGTKLVGDASSGFSIYQIVSQPEIHWADLKD
ncbi:hypothetical protein CBX57_004200 [Salmonella enterica]|nr:hypothetical protein [Salmonella enterica]